MEENAATEDAFLELFEDCDEEFFFEKERIELNRIQNSFCKDIAVVFGISLLVMIVIYFLIVLFGFQNVKPIVQAKAAAQPFFTQMHRMLIEDGYDGIIRYSKRHRLSVQMFYSPFSISSKHFRGDFFQVAKNLRKNHPTTYPYFSAVNCFDSSGKCKKKYKITKYPILMATTHKKIASIYNGPLDEFYVTRWLNRLQNSVVRISFAEELINFARNRDMIVIGYYSFEDYTSFSPNFKNYTQASFQFNDGDPNAESTIFCYVTDETLAAQFGLHNENDVVFVDSKLQIIYSSSEDQMNVENFLNVVKHFSKKEQEKSLEYLSIGTRVLSSSYLAERINQSSVFLYLSTGIEYGGKRYSMLREVVNDYFNCNEKHFLDENQDEVTDVVDDCSASVDSYSCNRNSTLKFLLVDTLVDTQLATKFGAENNDMIIAINGEQELTKFVRGNVTRELVNCLIHQHHEAAENQFVVETSRIIDAEKTVEKFEEDPDAIGEPSFIERVTNFTNLMEDERSLVILFSGGVWHSASSSAFAPFHQAASHFAEVDHIVRFVIVDATLINVPFNFDFETLPRIIVTAPKSSSNSWSYPEELPITYTNLVTFVTTRSSLQLRMLPYLMSCDADCRIRSMIYFRSEKSHLKVSLRRNSRRNTRIRSQLAHLNRVMKIMS